MAGSAAQVVTFDPGVGQYVLEGCNDPDHPAAKYRVKMPGDLYQVSLVSANFGAQATVTFDIYGMPSSSGTVVIQTGGMQKSIVLDALTGKATIH